MQLTTQRLKQIIKEELEAIVSEMSDETETETELTAEEEKVASLEQQLAEAKKKVEIEKKGGKQAAMKGKEAAMKGKEKPVGKRATGAPDATPMKAKNVGNLYGKGATKMSTKK
jgi:predicted RNase H-like nuclease (RuvC/YqgF family)